MRSPGRPHHDKNLRNWGLEQLIRNDRLRASKLLRVTRLHVDHLGGEIAERRLELLRGPL